MKPLYTEQEFNYAKGEDQLPCECYNCNETFKLRKTDIKKALNPKRSTQGKFCSRDCSIKYKRKVSNITLVCNNCGTTFLRAKSQAKRSTKHYCSNSCNTTYCNKHKKYGTRRSKLEVWLEEKLTTLYPNLPINFNQKDAIGSELDIHIPSLNLAFELNGIFHYEPIFGVDKLGKIQENDVSKSKACIDNQIDLCTIDTSGQKYFKPKTSQKYLDIITNIINDKLTQLEPVNT